MQPESDTKTAAGGPLGWYKRLWAMPNDSRPKTLTVALTLCLICSVLVAASAVFLKPAQQANRDLDRKRNILAVAGLLEQGGTVDELFQRIEARVVDLASGDYTDAVDPAVYDQYAAAKDPALSEALASEQDPAGIRRLPRYATVYLVKDGERVTRYILPVHGYGLWSTLYGFIALEADARTIAGLRFYQHAETPGLGGEVDNPRWQALWPGKLATDADGEPVIELGKGPASDTQVDALSGATLTSRGITNLLQFWLGERGLGAYLARLRSEGASNG